MTYRSHDPNAPDVWCSTCQDTGAARCHREGTDDCGGCDGARRLCIVDCPACERCRCGAVLTERNVEAHAACNAGVQ